MTISVLAPAKLNLGLEITGKRPDGYHDLKTVFCAVSVFDRVRIDNDGTFPPLASTDLAERARQAFGGSAGIAVQKRIPVAAGLGGGSSDAAAVLRGLDRLAPGQDLQSLALSLGSDVPFLLRGGISIGAGRGDLLDPLPFRPLWFVLLTFDHRLDDKTRAMFAALEPGDFSDGAAIAQVATMVRDNPQALGAMRLPNGFRRALYSLFPEVAAVAATVETVTGLPVQVTGAGPTLYLVARDFRHALSLRSGLRLAGDLRGRFDRCLVVRSVSRIPIVESRP